MIRASCFSRRSSLVGPHCIARDQHGQFLLVGDAAQIKKVSLPNGEVTPIAGNSSCSGFHDGDHLEAKFGFPISGICVHPISGQVFVLDPENDAVRIVFPEPSLKFPGKVRTLCSLPSPQAICLDSESSILYIATGSPGNLPNHQIWKIDLSSAEFPQPVLLSGAGLPGHRDSNQHGRECHFNFPQGVLLCQAELSRKVLLVTDSLNHCIREVDLVNGCTRTIAGIPGHPGYRDGQLQYNQCKREEKEEREY